MPLQKNDVIPLAITALSSDGNGVGRADGMAVFVPFSAAGDFLRVKIVKVCKHHAFGIIDAIETPAPTRIAPQCALFGKCGGCCFWHITYEAELAAKQEFVADSMRRLGKIDAPVSPILPSPQAQRYRNKVQYPLTLGTAQADGNAICAGFYAERSHRLIPCCDCLLQPQLLGEIVQSICSLLQTHNVSIYKEETHKGLVRHVYLRHALTTNQVMVCLVINGHKLPHAQEICDALCAMHPEVCTVVLNINTARTNVITGNVCIALHGDGLLHDTMSGVPVALSPLSFYQVNTLGAQQLYKVAAQLAALEPNDVLLDLYCGAGTIGLSMLKAQLCKKLIGVEIVAQAIESARRSAAAMGFANAEFLCGDAGTAASALAAQGLRPTVVVLDPPRKGCTEETLSAVVSMSPQRVVMVSCNAATAARDARYLTQNGYTVMAIQPVDLFARTRHVETVVLLSHENS